MAQLLNLGKVAGNNATINGKEAIEIKGINDTEVITNDDGTVDIDSSKVVTKDRIVEGLGYNPSEVFSNPNLLVNPDFKINQRGLATYTGNVYGVDRWYNSQCTVTVNDDSSLTISAPDTATVSSIRQFIKPDILTGKTITISVDCDILTEGARVCIQLLYNNAWTSAVYHSELGRQIITQTYDLPNEITTDIQLAIMLQKPTGSVPTEVKVYSAKLEIGSVATQFVAPNPTEELIKIQSMNDDGTAKLVSNDTLPTLMNSQMVSNPNLLINPDFKINQRGKTEYSGTTNEYCVDGWMLATSGTDPYYFNTVGNILRDDSTTSFKTMRQYIENPQRLSNKTVTFSVKLKSTPTTTWNIQLWLWEGGETSQNLRLVSTTDALNILTITLPEMSENAQLACVIAIDTANSGEISLENTKLEIGSVATPFISPNPITEKVKCGIPDDTSEYGYRAIANADSVSGVTVSNDDTLGLRKIYAGTSDMTAGTSALESGAIYLVYE